MQLRKQISYKLIPLIILFLFSIASGFVLFYKGYPLGDDSYFHFAQIEDIYLAIKRNDYNVISSAIGGGFGYGKRLFHRFELIRGCPWDILFDLVALVLY